jgi:hypothetical protein
MGIESDAMLMLRENALRRRFGRTNERRFPSFLVVRTDAASVSAGMRAAATAVPSLSPRPSARPSRAATARSPRATTDPGMREEDSGSREGGMRARFPHSDLSDEVAAMVFIPRDASRDPEDEWHFEKAEAGGRLAWGLSPPEPADAIEAAASLHRLARACLGRVAASATADAGCSIEPAPGAHRGVLLELLRSARDASSGRDEPNAQYLILTAALSVIERRCADLYVTGEDASRDETSFGVGDERVRRGSRRGRDRQ